MKQLVVFILLQFLMFYNGVSQAQWVQTSKFPQTTQGAQISQWVQTNGPGSGTLSSLAASGDNIIVCTNTGSVYFSSDNGTNWKHVNNISTKTIIRSFAFSLNDILAGTDSNGVYRSTDNGMSWTPVNNGMTNLNVRSLMINGTDVFAGTGEGFYISTDNGSSWTQKGLNKYSVNAITMIGTNILAGTDTGGVYFTTNKGTNWSQINNGLKNKTVHSLAISASNIFAGTAEGLFLSTDNGSNWTMKRLYRFESSVYFIAANGNNIYASVEETNIFETHLFRSTDNGINWTGVPVHLGKICALAVSGINVFAGIFDDYWLDYGVYRSSNIGINWAKVGLPTSSVYALTINGANIFAGTQYPYISTDNGIQWSVLRSPIIWNMSHVYGVYSLAVVKNNIFMGANNSLWSSPDNGINWNYIYEFPIYSFAVSGTSICAGENGSVLYLTSENGNTWNYRRASLPIHTRVNSLIFKEADIYAGTNNGIFLSSDNGTDWSQANDGLADSIIHSLSVIGNSIFAGTDHGIYASRNNGKIWKQVGLTANRINSLVVSGNNIFTGTDSGVYLSTNNGANWTLTGLTDNFIYCLAIDGTNIFAGTYGSGVWKRSLSDLIPVTNCPLSHGYWKNHPDKWPAILPLMLGTINSYSQSQLLSIFGAPVKGDASIILAHQLIAAKLNVANNSPLPAEVQNAIANSDAAIGTAIIPAGVKPYSALGQTMITLAAILDDYNNGKLTPACHSGLAKEGWDSQNNINAGLPDKYELLGNYPDPFNPTTKISFILPEANFVTLKIYNSVGQLVRTLINENMNKGYHTREWNATNDNGNNLATGIYIYRLQAGNFVKTSKMIFMK